MQMEDMTKVYKINIDLFDDITGLDAISLVESPAVKKDFLVFSEDKKLVFNDEEKRIITGVAILADTPIYRRDNSGNEYYVIFDKETIQKLVEKYSKNNLINSVNIEHNDNDFVDGVTMIESYIVDKSRGICPKEFEDIPDGSWIVSYKVENDEVWNKIKSEELFGFSVQGIFKLVEEKISSEFSNKNIKNSKMNKFREAVKELLMKYSDVMTDKGELEWEEDAQLEVGYKVYQNDMPAPDGEYRVDDKIFVVVDGAVAEIRDMAVPDEEGDKKVEEEMKKEKCADEEALAAMEARISALETKIEELMGMIEAADTKMASVEEKLAEIETKEPKNVAEEFSATNVKVNDKGVSKAMKYVESLK